MYYVISNSDFSIKNDEYYVKKEIMENCSLADDRNSVLTYGPFGNTYYDIVVERNKQGEVAVNFYQVGTYEKLQTRITLQPINR